MTKYTLASLTNEEKELYDFIIKKSGKFTSKNQTKMLMKLLDKIENRDKSIPTHISDTFNHFTDSEQFEFVYLVSCGILDRIAIRESSQ